jgi:hypothetical protein
MRSADLMLRIGLILLVVGGCSSQSPTILADPSYEAERGRSYLAVVAAPRQPALAVPADEARRLVANGLRNRWFNVLDVDALTTLDPGLAPLLQRAALDILAGKPVNKESVDRLARLHGVGQLLVVDVYQYDQYWGRETKITRVGVEARLVQLVDGRTLWEGRNDPELSGAPGTGYDAATRQAAQELVRVLLNEQPRWRELPMMNWPVINDLAPN